MTGGLLLEVYIYQCRSTFLLKGSYMTGGLLLEVYIYISMYVHLSVKGVLYDR